MKRYDNEKPQNWTFAEAIGVGISLMGALLGVALILFVAHQIGASL